MTGRDLPILFSAPMVRALLAGTKTQTRRAISLPTKGEYVRPDMGGWEPTTVGGAGVTLAGGASVPEQAAIWNQTTGTTLAMRYRVGDRLYVREHWRVSSQYDDHAPAHSKDGKPVLRRCGMTVMFEAGGSIANDRLGRWTPDNDYPPSRPDWAGKFRQGMHMPRWASRITLTVTEVRVERLQDIGADDAIAEGIELSGNGYAAPGMSWVGSPELAYRCLWQAINGEGSWEANPWVAAYTFTVALGNIDQLARAA